MPERTDERHPVDVAAEEFAERVRNGECPSVSDYTHRFPEFADEINNLLPTVAQIEQLRKEENAQRQTAQVTCHGGLPKQIGDYQILREIGRGGMGVVYEAQQQSLGRRVALKVLTSGVSSPKQLQRFHREAQSAAQLHHTNIVPVYGVGEQDGLHYYVMQLIEGVGLDRVIEELRQPQELPSDDEEAAAGDGSSHVITCIAAARALRDGKFASGSRPASSTPSRFARQIPFADKSKDSTQPGPVADTKTSVRQLHEDGDKETSDRLQQPGCSEPPGCLAAQDRLPVSEVPTRVQTDGTPPSNEGSPSGEREQLKSRGASQLDRRYWKSVARIGVQLADALDYAHSQRVLHRDIKPSNLLLDGHDTVWITDFGLAKLAESGNLTNTGDIVGTLRYMAPEQFSGIYDRRTDIYSLGVTLFELLTLQPAFGETQHGLLIQKITQEGPQRPRSINPEIPRDLETIVLKATASEPNRRYGSARNLADDLQRFLDDRPIKARRVTAIERLWRWSRRNPATASLATVLMLVVLSALVVISWKWQEAEKERNRFEAEKQRAEAESIRAHNESGRAMKENRRAEANLSLALDSMDQFLDRFASTWMAHPSEPQEEGEEAEIEFRVTVSEQSAVILQDALNFYSQFADENAANPRLQRDTAKAYRRVGEIHERLGQYEKAETAYANAVKIFSKQTEQFPDDKERAAQTASTLNELGLVYATVGRYEDAEKQLDRARILLTEQVAAPRTASCRYELARTYSNLGHVYWRLKKRREATENHRRALGLLERLVDEHPARAEYRLALARSYRSVFPFGTYGKHRGDHAHIRLQAVMILEKLVEDFPEVPDYQCELSETLAITSRWLGRSEDQDTVKAQLNRAVDLARQLHTQYPTIPRYQAALAAALEQLASHLKRDSKEQAEPLYREAVELFQSLADEFPAVPAYQFYLAMALYEHGDVLQELQRYSESRAVLESAIEHQKQYLESRPETGFGEHMLARQCDSLAKTLTQLGEVELAASAFEEAQEMRAESEKKRFGRSRGRRGDGRRDPPSFGERPPFSKRPQWPSRSREDFSPPSHEHSRPPREHLSPKEDHPPPAQ